MKNREQTYLLGFIAVYVILTLGITAAGYFYYRCDVRNNIETAQNQLQSIADLKVAQLTQWRRERIADAAIICTSPYLRERIGDPIHSHNNKPSK